MAGDDPSDDDLAGDDRHPRAPTRLAGPGASDAARREFAAILDRAELSRDATTIVLDGPAYEDWDGTWDEHQTGLFVGTAAVDEGRVLLVSNAEREGWEVPGGSVDPGESLRTAAVREVREETGVGVRLDRPLYVERQTFVHPDHEASAVGNFVLFAATPTDTTLADDPGIAGETIADLGWFASLPEETAQSAVLRSLQQSRRAD